MPLITDFGEARVGEMHEGLIERNIHRAPEVIIEIRWTVKAEIWNFGVLVSMNIAFYPCFSSRHRLTRSSRSGISSKIITYLTAGDQTVAIQMHSFWLR